MEIGPAAGLESRRRWREERESQVLGCEELWSPGPDASAGSSPLEPELNCIRLRSVGCAKIGKDRTSGKGRDGLCTDNARHQNGFTTTRITMPIIRIVGTSLIIR